MSFNKTGPSVPTDILEEDNLSPRRETFYCKCCHPDHAFFVEFDKEWGVSVYVSASNYAPLYLRVWIAFKYVFNVRSLFWDSILLSSEDVTRLKDLLAKYEQKIK